TKTETGMRVLRSALLRATILAMAIPSGAGAQTSPQTWPARSIRLVAPVSPGIATDVAARMLAESLSRSLGQQVYVENVPGAAGTIGTAAGAGAPARGQTPPFRAAGEVLPPKSSLSKLPLSLSPPLPPRPPSC